MLYLILFLSSHIPTPATIRTSDAIQLIGMTAGGKDIVISLAVFTSVQIVSVASVIIMHTQPLRPTDTKKLVVAPVSISKSPSSYFIEIKIS